jgi:hypothetical protein
MYQELFLAEAGLLSFLKYERVEDRGDGDRSMNLNKSPYWKHPDTGKVVTQGDAINALKSSVGDEFCHTECIPPELRSP